MVVIVHSILNKRIANESNSNNCKIDSASVSALELIPTPSYLLSNNKSIVTPFASFRATLDRIMMNHVACPLLFSILNNSLKPPPANWFSGATNDGIGLRGAETTPQTTRQ